MTDSVPEAPGYAFWQKQVERLGDRDPLGVLEETPGRLGRLVAQYPRARFVEECRPGKWRPVEILGHLVDAEWIFGYRVRTVLCDVDPTFRGVDQDRWVEHQSWRDADPEDVLTAFRAMRAVNLAIWQRLSAEQLSRRGRHETAGVELTLEQMRRILAGHDLHHVAQLEAYLAD